MVRWTISPSVEHGEFRVWLVTADKRRWFATARVPVVAGRNNYQAAIVAWVPSGTYRVAVYWRPTVGGGWVAATKSAVFRVMR